jgi:hypothetical protein
MWREKKTTVFFSMGWPSASILSRRRRSTPATNVSHLTVSWSIISEALDKARHEKGGHSAGVIHP